MRSTSEHTSVRVTGGIWRKLRSAGWYFSVYSATVLTISDEIQTFPLPLTIVPRQL
jgi:hypothetical protein